VNVEWYPVKHVAGDRIMKTRLTFTTLEDRTTPANLYVNSLLDNTTAGNGLVTLREAIIAANTDTATDTGQTGSGADTIRFHEALGGGTINLGGTRLEVRNALTIIGPSRGLTIDANLQSQVFYFDGETGGTFAALLQNVTVTRGNTLGGEDIINGADSGRFAGGILNNQTNLTLNDVTVANNVSTSSGGGVYNWFGANSKLALINSLIIGNSAASYGGGLVNREAATLSAVNTTFSGNSAQLFGGAIIADVGVMTLTNVTASGNQAFGSSGASGPGGFIVLVEGATVVLHNSIASGNLSGTGSHSEVNGTLDAGSSNNIIGNEASSGGLTNGVNGNQVGVDPLLGPLAENGGLTKTHALSQNSPALGKASTGVSGYLPYDQRGTPRDLRSVDIGAYEAEHPLGVSSGPTSFSDLYAPKPSASANEAFIKGLYQATLGRAPEAAGLSGWLTAMANGANRRTVANGFVNSIENRTKQVTSFYKYFLNRAPDQAGLTYYVDALRRGVYESEVLNNFINSPEFLSNNSNESFVNKLYYGFLGRQSEQSGLNGWIAQLNSGMSRSTVASAILNSLESYYRVTGSYYAGYLQRMPSYEELDINYFTFGNTTFGGLAINVLASQEFFNNAGANLT
jgi:predicted outer membrane repeat protein